MLSIFPIFAFVATVFARPQGSSSGYFQSGADNGTHPDWPSHGQGNGTHGHGWALNAASNGTHGHGNGTYGNCLSDMDTQTLITGYTYLLQSPGGPDFNSTAAAILNSDKFMVMSDSINTLGNRTLGTPAYPSLQAFLASQAVTPPLPLVQTISSFHSCDKISWLWNATGIQNPKVPVANLVEVLGMIIFDVDVQLKKIDTVFSEFNTAAFQHDLGNPECQQK